MLLKTYNQKYTDISKISTKLISNTITVNGWVRTTRIQSTVAFIELHDGSTSKTIQLITENLELIEKLKVLTVGSSLSISGEVVKHPVKDELVEIKILEILYIGKIEDPITYILNAKKTSLEALRDHMDVRVKTRTFTAVFRIRAGLSKAMHDFWGNLGFHHLNPNIITTSDCEGGGEVFTISTLLNEKKQDIPTIEKTDIIDYNKDFFQKRAYLTVSSQLQLELLCAGLGKVWTSNKSFRSEKSKTNRHLAEFEHIEWEVAWANLDDLMDLSEQFTQYCFSYIINNHKDDLEELNKFTSKGIIEKLESFISKPYIRITYDEALEILEKSNITNLPKWGDDLGSECEKYLADVHFKHPLLVYNYPTVLKSFYMKQNPDGRTVQGCDLLVPGLGELIGSSVREENYEKIMLIINERKMDISSLKWYLDMRKNGSTPTAGAGLGFDRLVRICTGIENIRDAVPFPIAYQECKF